MIKANPGDDHFGFFYLANSLDKRKIVVRNLTSNKSWKDKHFFIGGAWGQTYIKDSNLYLIPSQFQELGLSFIFLLCC